MTYPVYSEKDHIMNDMVQSDKKHIYDVRENLRIIDMIQQTYTKLG